MNLIIDIGNTLQKIAVFNNDDCVYSNSFPLITKEILVSIFERFSIQYSIISSVASVDEQVSAYLQIHTKLIQYSHQTKLPITILYKNIETLGLDRIANAVGAATLFHNQNVLSIQTGSCLVFDFVNENGEYLGGSIAPGMKMRLEVLYEKTKNLPLLSDPQQKNFHFLGRDTEESILCGVINGMRYEIDGFINDYKEHFKELKVIITGGDALFLQKFIKNTIFAVSNLVPIGLNEIIKYNV